MADPRDFDDDEEREAPSFKLGGEVFHCVPEMPWGVLKRYITSLDRGLSGADDPGNLTEADLFRLGMDAMLSADEFLDAVLPDDDLVRFRAVLADKGRRVPGRKVQQIVQYLISAYTLGPTGGPSDSPDGSSPNESESTGDSSSPATRVALPV